ncbi:hypothetical protein [Tsuneonella amylolytica]|uniref:hypothetical protein n=1 Tax=Tsuneonella amylolytica TaxID=2338327 RepID=UPI0013C3E993|nr:hypothetical protein [Tsuneonella amylolytica]
MTTIAETSAVSLIVLCTFAAEPSHAQEVTKSVDVSVGGNYSSNPFLDANGSTGSISVYAEVAPRIRLEDETSNLQLNGAVRYSTYLSRYKSDVTGRLGLTGDRRLSERLRLRAAATITTSRSAAQDVLLGEPSVLNPDNTFPDLPFVDTTVAGLRTRATSFGLGAGLEYALSPTDALGIGLDSTYRTYDGPAGINYRTTSANFQYGRRLNESLMLKTSVEAGLVDYENRTTGDSRIFSPSVGVDWGLSETAKLAAQAGFAVVNTDLIAGGSNTRTYLTARGSYCDRLLEGSLCLSAQRSARPTGFAGVSIVTGIDLGYSRKITESDSISGSVRYTWTDQTSANGFATEDWNSRFGGIAGTYSRAFSNSLRGFVTGSYSKVQSDTFSRKPNFSIGFGLTKKFGEDG